MIGSMIILFVLAGCSSPAQHRETLAKIQDYSISADEFLAEVKDVPGFYRAGKTKEELLEDIIQKKLLLLEAQREGLDRDAPFMKMVEHFWEQSLLRAIMEKKTGEFSAATYVTEEEIKSRYDKMGQEIKAHVVIVRNKKAAQRLMASYENFQEAVDNLGLDLIEGGGVNSYYISYGSSFVEEFIFSLPPEKNMAYTQYRNLWLVVKLLERQQRPIQPLSDILKKDIRKTIARQKANKSFKQWLGELRNQAKIHINKKALEKIALPGEE